MQKKKSLGNAKKNVIDMEKAGAGGAGESANSQTSTIFGTSHFHLEDLHSQLVATLLTKLDHFFDNPIEENVQLLQLSEQVLNYDLDLLKCLNKHVTTQSQLYFVKKDVLLRVMSTIQKCETEFLGRVSLLNTSLQKQAGKPSYVGRNAL